MHDILHCFTLEHEEHSAPVASCMCSQHRVSPACVLLRWNMVSTVVQTIKAIISSYSLRVLPVENPLLYLGDARPSLEIAGRAHVGRWRGMNLMAVHPHTVSRSLLSISKYSQLNTHAVQ